MQERHAPPQELLQQTPSTQWSDAHSLPFPEGQEAPFILGPQLAFTHLRPATQFVSLAQVGKHWFVFGSHENGAHTVVAPTRQCPAPSQTLVPVTASPSQVPGTHTVPAWYVRHFPAPSQVPSRAQVAARAAGHWLATRGFLPEGISAHLPRDVGNPQDWQTPSQAESQQTPSAQFPLEHSPAQVQVCPLDLSPVPLVFVHAASVEASFGGVAPASRFASTEVLHPTAPVMITTASAASPQILTDLFLVPIGYPKVGGDRTPPMGASKAQTYWSQSANHANRASAPIHRSAPQTAQTPLGARLRETA